MLRDNVQKKKVSIFDVIFDFFKNFCDSSSESKCCGGGQSDDKIERMMEKRRRDRKRNRRRDAHESEKKGAEDYQIQEEHPTTACSTPIVKPQKIVRDQSVDIEAADEETMQTKSVSLSELSGINMGVEDEAGDNLTAHQIPEQSPPGSLIIYQFHTASDAEDQNQTSNDGSWSEVSYGDSNVNEIKSIESDQENTPPKHTLKRRKSAFL